ncbi:hypothetical protein [Mycobacterium helveticum]|nr:hypothetical protein [Mycobacterium helveticum]
MNGVQFGTGRTELSIFSAQAEDMRAAQAHDLAAGLTAAAAEMEPRR